MHQLIASYDWVEHQDVVMTFAVIQRSTVQEVVRVYGGDSADRKSTRLNSSH